MAVFDSLPKRPVGRPRRDGKPAGSVPKASSGRPRGRPRNDGLPAGSVKRPQVITLLVPSAVHPECPQAITPSAPLVKSPMVYQEDFPMVCQENPLMVYQEVHPTAFSRPHPVVHSAVPLDVLSWAPTAPPPAAPRPARPMVVHSVPPTAPSAVPLKVSPQTPPVTPLAVAHAAPSADPQTVSFQAPTATPMAPTMVPHLGTSVAPSMAPSIALSMALSLAPPITPPITPPSAPPSQPPAPARPSGPVPASQILMNLHLFQPIIPAPEPTISPFRPGSSEYEYKCIEPPPQTINPAYLTLSNHKPGGMYLHRRSYNPRPDPSGTRPEAACRPELTPEQELVIFRRERDAEMERVVAHAREVADRVVADMPVDEEWDTAPEFAPGRW
ncbi:hypothetical protein MCOR25_005883 [Pyricularia grisea]|nr:hypothetical protein MCOR25_005883 [Pyricularia grisea]